MGLFVGFLCYHTGLLHFGGGEYHEQAPFLVCCRPSVLPGFDRFYPTSHQFLNTAHNSHFGIPQVVAVGSDGVVFLANGNDGLRAYTYDGSAFTNTAHRNDGDYAFGLAVGPDGTVFSRQRYDGCRAYTYDGMSLTNTPISMTAARL